MAEADGEVRRPAGPGARRRLRAGSAGAPGTWYRLDNIGTFYAAQAGEPVQTVFRYAATLDAEVDPDVLQRALEETCALFPGFNVCLRSGAFWHYLEPAPEPPRVQREDLPICFGLHVNADSVLFRVSFFRARVNLEVSHIVSDGRGSLAFFRTLLTCYLRLAHGLPDVPLPEDASPSQQVEDSFDKYFERGAAGRGGVSRVYRLRGFRDASDPTFLEMHLPVGEVLALARSWGVSVTSLIAAVVMDAVRAEMPRRERDRAVCLDVPVDLRQVFPSATTKNFFGLAFVSHVPGERDVPVEELARDVQAQLKAGCAPEQLKRRVMRMVALEKSPWLRFAPLLLKDAVLGLAEHAAERESTTTMSNLGVVRLDPRVGAHVRDVSVLTRTTGMKFAAISFGDDLCVSVCSSFTNMSVPRRVARFFTGRGMACRVNANRTDAELEEGRAAAEMEGRVRRLAEREGERA